MNANANVILDWLEATDAAAFRAHDRHEGPGSLVAHLRAIGRADLADEVMRAEDEHTPDDQPPRSVELAIGSALVRYVANDPAHVRFEVVDQLLSHHPSVWRSFLEEAASTIDADVAVRAALEDGTLKGDELVKAKVTLSIESLGLSTEIDGDINLA